MEMTRLGYNTTVVGGYEVLRSRELGRGNRKGSIVWWWSDGHVQELNLIYQVCYKIVTENCMMACHLTLLATPASRKSKQRVSNTQ